MINLYGYGWTLAAGTWVTIQVATLSLVVAAILGMLTAMAKLSKSKPLQAIAGTYTTIIRGVPDLVLMLLIFFGLQVAGEQYRGGGRLRGLYRRRSVHEWRGDNRIYFRRLYGRNVSAAPYSPYPKVRGVIPIWRRFCAANSILPIMLRARLARLFGCRWRILVASIGRHGSDAVLWWSTPRRSVQT